MTEHKVISCDNPECYGGSSKYKRCKNGHDICGVCSISIDKETEPGYYCPICLKKAKLDYIMEE